jgi:ABC-type multidrug transport system fused ATPase/permease subunit
MHSSRPGTRAASSPPMLAKVVEAFHRGAGGATGGIRTKGQASSRPLDGCSSCRVMRGLCFAASGNFVSLVPFSRSVLRNALGMLPLTVIASMLTRDREAVAGLLVAIHRPATPPISLLILYSSIVTSQLILFTHNRCDLLSKDTPIVLGMLTAMSAIGIILCMPMRNPQLPKDEISPVFQPPTSRLRSPEDNLTLLQFMTVSWMSPLISVGAARTMQDEDVWSLSYEFQHRLLHDRFRGLSGSVLKRLLEANALDLVLISLLALVELLANFSVPVLLQQLLRSMEDADSPKRAAITYAILSLVVRLIASQVAVLNLWFSRRAYERSRGELITMLYEKTLTRKIVGVLPNSSKSPESASMGKIMNHMRFDSYEIAQRFWEFQSLITQPVSLVLSVVLIWRLIGWPCLIGVLTTVIAQGLNALAARALIRWETIRREATDDKLQKISQFVEAIRHLRWYGWQEAWLERIMKSRQNELNLRVVTSLWNILISFINALAISLFPVAAFCAYTLLAGRPLRIDIAFPALQLFTMLETSLREIPGMITMLLNASVAVGRVQGFMDEPDKIETKAPVSTNTMFELRHAFFAWPGASEPVLHDITLSFPIGLTVVWGEVAAGKTALLQALLGELDWQGGEFVRPNEIVGYCAQTPWLQNMSIRENILFSSPYDPSRYKQVLEACALIPDMANFKHGDLSEIGEAGIGLSGGQKARVALARAVYSSAKILLLDDPLSALDHQTAETIVQKCLGGPLLEGRTTILVTHRTELCHSLAKQVVQISEGSAQVMDAERAMSNSLYPVKSSESAGESDHRRDAEQQLAAIPEKFVEDEHRADGGVKAAVYWEYIKAGKLKWWALLIGALALFRLIEVGETWFLKEWGEAYNKRKDRAGSGLFDRLPSPEVNIRPWLVGFFLLATAQSLAFLISQGFMLIIIYTAGRDMFKRVMDCVSHATFRYYDVTPVGRLMNRLTSDCNTIDGNISNQFQNVARWSIAWISSIVVIASVTPMFLVFSLALTAGFVLIFLRFLPTSQSLRRLEMVSLTPLMSNFGALLAGLTTVRAFGAQHHFQQRIIAVTDTFQKMDHFYWSLQAWLSYRFDTLSACSTLLLTLLALYTNVSPGLTAFVLIAASRFVDSTHYLCRQYGQLQMDFVSVERVVEMLHLEQEPKGTTVPPAWWPNLASDIVFEDVTIRYAPHLDPSLLDVSLRIKGGSSTVVVGRTGSGKSTLTLTLLATILPESGRITIGDMDLSTVDKQALRTRITFLAQDPVLFPGSMRENLDPLEEYSDEACQSVLVKVCGRHQWALDTQIDTGGRNLSQGQRQLIGLARALLRRSPIIIFDEATASIDTETAVYIQQILREEMRGSTVITIAHRAEAVAHADYCVVLGKGRVVRQGRAADMLG